MSETPTLRARTEELRLNLQAQAPVMILEEYDAWAAALGERNFAAAAPPVGEPAPLFTLPDAGDSEVSLGALLEAGPVALTFYRGAWCPYCNLQLCSYQEILPELRARGAQLGAVSPQTPDNSLLLVEKAGLEFAVLSDAGAAVAELYGLVVAFDRAARDLHVAGGVDLEAENGDDSWRLPAPASFVLDRDGIVRFAHVSGDYRWRVEPADVLAALDALD